MSNDTIKSIIKAGYEDYNNKFNSAPDANEKIIETEIFGAYLRGASAIIALRSGPDAAADEKVVDAVRRVNQANADRLRSEEDLKDIFA